jgi:hypothetical protein
MVYQYAGVYSANTFYGFLFRLKGTVGLVGDCHTNSKPASILTCGSGGEIEVIFAIPIYTIGCPHRIGFGSYPRNGLLTDNYTMVLPIDQVIGREDMIVRHAKPFLEPFNRTGNIM